MKLAMARQAPAFAARQARVATRTRDQGAAIICARGDGVGRRHSFARVTTRFGALSSNLMTR